MVSRSQDTPGRPGAARRPWRVGREHEFADPQSASKRAGDQDGRGGLPRRLARATPRARAQSRRAGAHPRAARHRNRCRPDAGRWCSRPSAWRCQSRCRCRRRSAAAGHRRRRADQTHHGAPGSRAGRSAGPGDAAPSRFAAPVTSAPIRVRLAAQVGAGRGAVAPAASEQAGEVQNASHVAGDARSRAAADRRRRGRRVARRRAQAPADTCLRRGFNRPPRSTS